MEAGNEQARSLVPEGTTQLARRLRRSADRVARLEQLIPRGEEVPALLEALAAEARRSGLGDLAFIRPGEEEGQSVLHEAELRGVPWRVATTSWAAFLTAVASLPRIVTPVELEMTSILDPSMEEDSDVRAHFRIETYVRPTGRDHRPRRVERNANQGRPMNAAPMLALVLAGPLLGPQALIGQARPPASPGVESASAGQADVSPDAAAGEPGLDREVFVYPGGDRRGPV